MKGSNAGTTLAPADQILYLDDRSHLPSPPSALVVEDDDALSRLYSSILRFSGLNTEVAHDGWTALESVDIHKPDVVVLDLDLPRLDGATVFRELRGNPATREIPILIVTGVDGELLKSAHDGEVRVLRKPVAPDDLSREVRRLLRPD